MLMLFPTVKVPGLDDIEIFRDHEKADTFYALRGRPRLAVDDQGNPQLSFYLFSRNADIAYASSPNKELVEAQLGQLLFTTDLSISEEEHKIITDYLSSLMEQPNHTFVRLYSRLVKKGNPFIVDRANKPIIKLGTPNTWKEGTAKLELLEGLGETFKKESSKEVNPTLVGSNSAAFYATFGIEGAQLFYDALTKGYQGEPDSPSLTPLQAIVRYDLKGFAFVPGLEVKVTANSTQIFNQIQTYEQNYRTERRGTYKVEYGWFTKKVTDSRSVTVRKEDISKMIERMIDDKVIKIEITDFADVAANNEEIKEIETNLRESLMRTVMETIIPNFFTTAFIGNEKKEDEGGNGQPTPNPDMGISEADKARPTVDTHYYFRSDVDKTKINTLNFEFKKNCAVEFRRYPNGTLTTQLTEDQRKQLVRLIDISSPEIQILEVQLSVNADFKIDNIHSIIVNISYSQTDHKSGIVRENSKSFMYKTGAEVYTFRVTMARNEKGELIDFYNVEAKISYVGTAISPPPIELKNISDRALVVSYDKLGFITVDCIAGDIDWSLIKEAIVTLQYPDAPNQPDTTKEIRLSKENPTGNWRCYMYGNKSKNYAYKVHYVYLDGREADGKEKTDSRGNLLIDDLLTGRVKASFDVILDPNTVKTAKVEVLYEEPAFGTKDEFSHWFANSETWDWSMRLREGSVDTFKYRYFVQFKDDVVFTSAWQDCKSEQDIPPIHLRRYPKTCLIDGSSLDWNKWQVVFVTVSYEENDYFVNKTITLENGTRRQNFEVLAFTSKGALFQYDIQYVGAGSDIVKVEGKENAFDVLIVKEPVVPIAAPTP